MRSPTAPSGGPAVLESAYQPEKLAQLVESPESVKFAPRLLSGARLVGRSAPGLNRRLPCAAAGVEARGVGRLGLRGSRFQAAGLLPNRCSYGLPAITRSLRGNG